MLELILPPGIAAVTTREDSLEVTLYPQEEAVISRAVERRRREFTTARACARQALNRLGLPSQPIPAGARGEPLWPAGVVGSITHCTGYRACAAALAGDLATIGVDAEVDEPLPNGVLGDIALPQEREWIAAFARETPAMNWDRLLFSIKESVYKAWYPLTQRWLGFEDATVAIDPRQRSFTAQLLVPGPRLEGRELKTLSGRWLARDGLLLAAIALPAVGRDRDFGAGSSVGEDCT